MRSAMGALGARVEFRAGGGSQLRPDRRGELQVNRGGGWGYREAGGGHRRDARQACNGVSGRHGG